MSKRFTYQTPLARARGWGSARSGVHAFLVERITAVALIPLGLWFVYSMLTTLISGNQLTLAQWLQSPFTAVFLFLLSSVAFLHSASGIRVVLEDYVHKQPYSAILLLFNNFLHVLLGVLTAAAIVKLHYTPLPA